MSLVEIVKWRGGYYVACADHVWVGFREESEARRFVEQKLLVPAAVVVYREDGGSPPRDEQRGGRITRVDCRASPGPGSKPDRSGG